MEKLARVFEWLVDAVFPPADTARLVRECSPESFGALLAPRMLEDGTVALLPYRHRLVRAAVIEAKFHRNERAFALLSGALAEYLDTLAQDREPFDSSEFCIVPVPLGKARQKERGYNQVREIAARTRLPVQEALIRVRETLPQTRLSRALRLRNMEGAFACRMPTTGTATYIVLDDVVTTGATLSAAAGALRASGARVETLALAH